MEFLLCKGNATMGSSPQKNYHQTSYSEEKMSTHKKELILLEQVCNMAANSLILLIKMWESMKCPFESEQVLNALTNRTQQI